MIRAPCPVCGFPIEVALTAELLAEAERGGAARAVASCPRGHPVILTVDKHGAVRGVAAAVAARRPDCEVTERAPPSLRPRLLAITERGPANDSDRILLEKAKEAGWVVC